VAESEGTAPALAVCLTCRDEAQPARVVRFLHGHFAVVNVGPALELLDLALVDAPPGDTVFMQARVAIGKAAQ
jgi:hypothetical protein